MSSETSDAMQLADMSDDALFILFSKLSIWEVIAFDRASKRFHQLSRNYIRKLKKIDLNLPMPYDQLLSDDVILGMKNFILSRCGPNLQELRLGAALSIIENKNFVKTLAVKCPNLRRLKSGDIHAELLYAQSTENGLKELSFRLSSDRRRPPYKELLLACPNLEVLDISVLARSTSKLDWVVSIFETRPSKLKELSILFQSLSQELLLEIKDIIKFSPNLTTIDIRYCPTVLSFNKLDLERLYDLLKNVKFSSFGFNGDGAEYDDSFAVIGEHLTSLDVTVFEPKPFLNSSLSKLKELTINFDEHSEALMPHIISTLSPSVRHLILYGVVYPETNLVSLVKLRGAQLESLQVDLQFDSEEGTISTVAVDELIHAIADHCQNIHSIEISTNIVHRASESLLNLVTKRGKQLQNFELSNVIAPFKLLKLILTECKQLKNLNIGLCKAANDSIDAKPSELKLFFKQLPELYDARLQVYKLLSSNNEELVIQNEPVEVFDFINGKLISKLS
ncbi:hypothetical protein HDE_01280 [Halotydeus destructor]|nr:hypothetical protein HDE_01280 [Halotydeus destructor]